MIGRFLLCKAVGQRQRLMCGRGKYAANLVNSADRVRRIFAANVRQLSRLFLCWKAAQNLLVHSVRKRAHP